MRVRPSYSQLSSIGMNCIGSGFVPREQPISRGFVMLAQKLVESSGWPRTHGSSPKQRRLRRLDLGGKWYGIAFEPCSLDEGARYHLGQAVFVMKKATIADHCRSNITGGTDTSVEC